MSNRTTTGTIKTLRAEKGFGFIRAGNVEYFFHAEDLVGMQITDLMLDTKVVFTPTDTKKGPRAANVELAQLAED